MSFIQDNYNEIMRRIALAGMKAGRDSQDVQVIAVTKYVDVERMREAYEAGLTHFGENRTKDALPKMKELASLPITWHFIGHLQTNKVKDVLSHFSYIHSLDRPSLAEEMGRTAERLGIKPACFIQVNISGEETKSGVRPEDLDPFVRRIQDIGNLRVVGLMTMAPNTKEEAVIRPIFRRLRELRDQLLEREGDWMTPKYLSMGMSNDFEIAVEEGATHVRIGKALVGESFMERRENP